MPTIVTHAAVPLCLGLGLGRKVIPPQLLFTGVILAMLPDADVLSFKLGVAYGNVFGHRGFTHSLLAIPDGFTAVAQPVGFGHYWRQRRRLAVAVVG